MNGTAQLAGSGCYFATHWTIGTRELKWAGLLLAALPRAVGRIDKICQVAMGKLSKALQAAKQLEVHPPPLQLHTISAWHYQKLHFYSFKLSVDIVVGWHACTSVTSSKLQHAALTRHYYF